MEYSITKLASLAQISTRTLRYYDTIDLLKPCRTNSAGYRIYGTKEVDLLQQILFFRELGFELSQIKAIIYAPGFNLLAALKDHQAALLQRQKHLETLIHTVNQTILKEEGMIKMTDKEKFEGLKDRLINENEEKYGGELRSKYSQEELARSNELFKNMSKEDFDRMQELDQEIRAGLEEAVGIGAAEDSDPARSIAVKHQEWLSYSWPSYSAEAHSNLVDMYIMDERFTRYYDANVPGCAQLLHDAVKCYLNI